MPKVISSYRSFRREQEREFNSLTKGYVVEEDKEFESMCNKYIIDEIKISDFNRYLNRSLFLDINESSLNKYFDSSGNLIDYDSINEGWFRDAIDTVKDKVKATFNIATTFFKAIIDKIKSFVKNFLSKFATGVDKMMDLVSSFFDKVMSGLKYFGDFIKKNKKGLYSLLIKISVSLGITTTVTYLLSLFGPGWVVAMGTKTGVSAVSQKLKVGDKIASKIIKPEDGKEAGKEEAPKVERRIYNYSQFINEAEAKEEVKPVEEPKKESTVKKVAIALGQGIIKFFKILKKFKIAILIFLGAIWILGHMFSPFGNFLDPIFEATKMTHLGDIFKDDFIASAAAIPAVKIDPTKITEITINKIEIPALKDEHDLGVNEIQTTSTAQLNSLSGGIKAGITEHPKEFCEDQAKLVNDLKAQLVGEESKGISGVNTEEAGELTQDQVEKTMGEDVNDMVKGDDVDISKEELELQKEIHDLEKKIHDLENKSSGSGCFVSGTLVTLFNGDKVKIEDIKEGDKVLTYNEESENQECGIVKSLIRPIKDDIISIKLSNLKEIKCTTEHPFFTINKGWSSFSPENSSLIHKMNISKLTTSDKLLDEQGEVIIITSMEFTNDRLQNVYNLEINGNHTYYANGVLVHNKDAGEDEGGEGDDGALKKKLKELKKDLAEKKEEVKKELTDFGKEVKKNVSDAFTPDSESKILAKQLEKEGWRDTAGNITLKMHLDKHKILVDNNIVGRAETEHDARLSLNSTLRKQGINSSSGTFIVKDEGNGYVVKFIEVKKDQAYEDYIKTHPSGDGTSLYAKKMAADAENHTNPVKLEDIDRMSKEEGYGFGSSVDVSTAKKIALMNSKIKGVIKEESVIRNNDGGYDYHVVVKR